MVVYVTLVFSDRMDFCLFLKQWLTRCMPSKRLRFRQRMLAFVSQSSAFLLKSN